MSHTQILLIITAIIVIIFGLLTLASQIKGKPLMPLTSDDLTADEKLAIERGELQTETINQKWRWLFFCILIPNTTNIIFGDKVRNCELVWGLDGYFWQNIICYSLFIASIIGYLYISARRYKKALRTGFMPRLKQQSGIYLVLVKATKAQIHQAFLLRIVLTMVTIVGVVFFTYHMTPDRIQAIDLEKSPKFSLSTYQLASQKLQQQCLVKKQNKPAS